MKTTCNTVIEIHLKTSEILPIPRKDVKYFTKVIIVSLTLVVFSLVLHEAHAFPGYKLLYKEQLYKLYQQRLYMYPENFAENILWLEEVLRADFANPLNALADIKDTRDWKWYRNVFLMHVNLLLVKQYLGFAKGYMKFHAYFYNAPFRDMTIRSMKKARRLVEYAKVYWNETLKYVENIKNMNLPFFSLQKIQHWENDFYRIVRRERAYGVRAEALEYKSVHLMNKTLDYGKIIERELQRIDDVMTAFQAMDENTY